MNIKSYFEAAVSSENAGRVIDILKDRIARQTGQQIYATKVVDHIIKSDTGHTYGVFMMLADGNHAIRLNWKSSDTSASISSIDFWVHVSQNPQLSINVEELNIKQIVDTIDDMVHGIKTSSEEVVESYVVEASGMTFKDVRLFFNSKGYTIEKDPAFTVRRYIVTHRKSGEQTQIRYIPIMDQMYDEVTSMGIEDFLNKYNAGTTQKSQVRTAAKEVPAEIKSTPFDALFEDPYTEEELFGLLDNGIKDVKSGKSKTLIISGDPGIGKCVHYTLDLPVQFF